MGGYQQARVLQVYKLSSHARVACLACLACCALLSLFQTNRDRFVLSNGHACALQYVMLHLTGYDLSMDDLKQFRQLNSKYVHTPHLVAVPHSPS